jgi:GNAT superfamily N-acetyltransferase
MNDRPRIEKLRRDHPVDLFDCGQEALNRFLVRYAFQNQQAEASQTYVALMGDEVAGFYTLVVAQVEYDAAPQRLGKGLARHPIPLMLLARLAVATSWQGKGLGSGLLKDAMLRTLQAADIAGIRAMAVHAKDDDARAFSERFGFVPAPTDPYHLLVLLKDVRAILKQRLTLAALKTCGPAAVLTSVAGLFNQFLQQTMNLVKLRLDFRGVF